MQIVAEKEDEDNAVRMPGSQALPHTEVVDPEAVPVNTLVQRFNAETEVCRGSPPQPSREELAEILLDWNLIRLKERVAEENGTMDTWSFFEISFHIVEAVLIRDDGARMITHLPLPDGLDAAAPLETEQWIVREGYLLEIEQPGQHEFGQHESHEG